MRFGVLTRNNAGMGLRLLQQLAANGLNPACIGVAEVTWPQRFRMARFLARKTGWANSLYHNSRIWTRHCLSAWNPRRTKTDYSQFSDAVLHSENVNGPAMQQFLEANDLDLLLLGQSGIIRKNILNIPRFGTFNAHPGQLPEYRGVDVVRWSLLDQQSQYATLHFVNPKVDDGPTIEMRHVPLSPEDEISDVEHRVVDVTIRMLVEYTQRYEEGWRTNGTVQPKGIGRQYYLMPRRSIRMLNRNWPRIRAAICEGEQIDDRTATGDRAAA